MSGFLTICKSLLRYNSSTVITKRHIAKRVAIKKHKPMSIPTKPELNILRSTRVSIEGNIGAGKTTLINYFAKQVGVETYAEPIEWWQNLDGHNLLNLLYTDIEKWYTVFQKYVQLTRLKVQTSHPKDTTTTQIFERSLQNNRYCFVEQAKSSGYLKPADYEVIHQWYEWINENIDIDIDLIVYLRTNPDIVYERMKQRGRLEENTIPYDYIKDLHESHEKWLLTDNHSINPENLIIIDGNKSLDMVLQQCDEFMDKIVSKRRTKKSRTTSIIK